MWGKATTVANGKGSLHTVCTVESTANLLHILFVLLIIVVGALV